MRGFCFGGLAVATAWLAGCSSPGPSRMNYRMLAPAPSKLNYAVTRIESTSRAAVLVAARTAIQEHFRIAESDPAAGLIRSRPLETDEVGRSRRLGDVLGTTRRIRRVAEVRVEEAGNAVRVFCKVVVQRYESDEQRLFVREHAVSDLPTDTPAQREAATTAEQNATWRTRGRDKGLERRILRAIEEHVVRAGGEATSSR